MDRTDIPRVIFLFWAGRNDRKSFILVEVLHHFLYFFLTDCWETKNSYCSLLVGIYFEFSSSGLVPVGSYRRTRKNRISFISLCHDDETLNEGGVDPIDSLYQANWCQLSLFLSVTTSSWTSIRWTCSFFKIDMELSDNQSTQNSFIYIF